MRSVHHLANGDITARLRAITSPVGDTTCACAHYQFLRFHSLVPCIYAPCKRPRTNQRWNNRSSPLGEIRTKDKPKNSQMPKVLFIKITVSFTSLIPSLILPTDEREKTERRAKRYRALAAKNSALFLRLLSKKVVSIPKKVDSHPKKVDSFPEIVYLSVPKKNAPKCNFSCSIQNKFVPLPKQFSSQ